MGRVLTDRVLADEARLPHRAHALALAPHARRRP